MKIRSFIIWAILTVSLFGQYNSENHVVTTSMYYLKSNPDGSWDYLYELMEDEFTKMNKLDKELVSLNIDPQILKEDKEMIEDLIIAAVNQGLENAEKAAEEKMGSLTGGMLGNIKIPGM